jgi:hypothetical protein
MREPKVSNQFFYFLTYIDAQNGKPNVYILPSSEMNRLRHEYKNRMILNGAKEENIWGVNWATPHPFNNNWSCLPA